MTKIPLTTTLTSLVFFAGTFCLAYTAGNQMGYASSPKSWNGLLVIALLVLAALIKEKLLATEAVEASQLMHSDLFENENDLVLKVESDGRILFANRKCLEVLGYRDCGVHPLSLSQLVYPEDMARCRDLLRNLITAAMLRHLAVQSAAEVSKHAALRSMTEASQRVLLRLITKTGGVLEVTGSAKCQSQGGPPYIIRLFLRDVAMENEASFKNDREFRERNGSLPTLRSDARELAHASRSTFCGSSQV